MQWITKRMFNFLDNRTVKYEDAKDIISQLKEVDVKAIGLGGGGDPNCHPNLEQSQLLREALRQHIAPGRRTEGRG